MPRSSVFLWNVCINIYKDMYKQTTPPLDFAKALKTKEVREENWFMKYYLSEKEQLKILDYHCKKHRLTPYEKARVQQEVFLGSAPNSSLKTGKESKGEKE